MYYPMNKEICYKTETYGRRTNIITYTLYSTTLVNNMNTI